MQYPISTLESVTTQCFLTISSRALPSLDKAGFEPFKGNKIAFHFIMNESLDKNIYQVGDLVQSLNFKHIHFLTLFYRIQIRVIIPAVGSSLGSSCNSKMFLVVQ